MNILKQLSAIFIPKKWRKKFPPTVGPGFSDQPVFIIKIHHVFDLKAIHCFKGAANNKFHTIFLVILIQISVFQSPAVDGNPGCYRSWDSTNNSAVLHIYPRICRNLRACFDSA